MLKKQLALSFFVASVILCIIITAIMISVGSSNNLLTIDRLTSSMVLGSVVLFFVLLFFATAKESWAFLILPIVFVAFPSVINNIFPRVPLSFPEDIGNVTYPIINHIELFLVLLIAKHYIVHKTLKLKLSFIFSFATFLFLTSTLIAIFSAPGPQNITVLGASIYPARLVLLLQIFLSNYQLKKEYIGFIVKGLMISVLFLLIESLVFTKTANLPVLTSGTLAVNSFGNIIGQISAFLVLYMYLVLPKHKRSMLYWIVILCGLAIVLLTTTRMALLAAVLIVLFFSIREFTFSKIIKMTLAISVVFIVAFSFVDRERFNLNNITQNITIDWNQASVINLTNFIHIERTPATSSIKTRLDLFQTSLNMFYDNPIWGIGYGNFNLMKYQYGFKERVLIDSHNGYLFLLSQIGLVGLIWIYLIYFLPFILLRKRGYGNPIFLLATISIGMAICDLTNAGIFKYSILSLLLFISIAVYYQNQTE